MKKSPIWIICTALFYAVLCIIIPVSCTSCHKTDVKPVRNIILMIPDGTSSGILSLLRWYRQQQDPESDPALATDPYICGMMRQYCSDAPIIESSAAITSYMTGYRVQGPNIGVYPASNPGQDLVHVCPDSCWQPLATVMEAAKILKHKSTGLVFTVYPAHATPAGTSAHVVKRSDTRTILEQMASNGIDVVIGGGAKYMTEPVKRILEDSGIAYQDRDVESFRAFESGRVWSLLRDKDMSYEIDRDKSSEPSLEEMTRKAISLLSADKNGFFLLVEGSKVDYAAHSNDAPALIAEYDAFDRAVSAALEFAKNDGNTTVIVIPDHGTAGVNAGNASYHGYSSKGLDSMFVDLPKVKTSVWKLEEIIRNTPVNEIPSVFREYTGTDLTPSELKEIKAAIGHSEDDYMKIQYSYNLQAVLSDLIKKRHHIGFVSGGHTSEDVFLAVYNPNGQRPEGIHEGTALADYMCSLLGLDCTLDDLTSEIYVRSDMLLSGHECNVELKEDSPVLIVDNGALLLPANRSYALKNGEKIPLGSVTVYVRQNGNFYISKKVLELLH
ncbi:MAG: alkaline phosphatase [Candidatus Cryptobacteroides sp.]